MSLRFAGGEQLQRGRGIGGLLRLMKSVFTPIAKKVGSTVVTAVKSKGAKKLLNVLKDQAIDSSMALASDALKGKNMNKSLNNEMGNAKSNLSSTIDELRKMRKRKDNSEQTGDGVKRRKIKKNKSRQLKRVKIRRTNKVGRITKKKSKARKRNKKSTKIDFFQ